MLTFIIENEELLEFLSREVNKYDNKQTPIYYAINNNDADSVEFLFDAGADVNWLNNSSNLSFFFSVFFPFTFSFSWSNPIFIFRFLFSEIFFLALIFEISLIDS